MSVEILSVSLSDETIERLARAVTEKLGNGSLKQQTTEPQEEQTADEGKDDADPWAKPGKSGAARAETSSTPAHGGSAAARPASGGVRTRTIKTKYGVQNWTFGLDDAPECECGEKCGQKSWLSKNNNHVTAWQCPKQGDGRWREDPCEFSEFVD